MDLIKQSTSKSDWLYSLQPKMEKSSIQSAETRPGADCGSDHELLIAKLRLKLKKVGETTRPFRYDLNQIPCYYTVELMNKFKGLDLVECLKNYGWGSWHCTGGSDQDYPKERIIQEDKVVVWGGLTNSWEKRRSKRQRRKGKIYPTEYRVPKNSKQRWESLPKWTM